MDKIKFNDIFADYDSFKNSVIDNISSNYNGTPLFLDFSKTSYKPEWIYKEFKSFYGELYSRYDADTLKLKLQLNLANDLPALYVNTIKLQDDFIKTMDKDSLLYNIVKSHREGKDLLNGTKSSVDYDENESIITEVPQSSAPFQNVPEENTMNKSVSRSKQNTMSVSRQRNLISKFNDLIFPSISGEVRQLVLSQEYTDLFYTKDHVFNDVKIVTGPKGDKGDKGNPGKDGNKVVTTEIKDLQDKDVVIEADIVSIKSKNANQDTLLGTHSNDIIRINAKNGAQDTKIASNTRIVNDVSSKFNVIDIDTTGLINTSYNTFLNSLDENRNKKVVFDSGSVKYYFAKKDTDNSGNPILFFNALIDKVVYIKALTIIKIIDNIEVVNIDDSNIDLSKTGSGGSGATITNHDLITTALVGGSLNTLKAKINKNSVYTFNNFTEYYTLNSVLNGSGSNNYYFKAISKDKELYVTRLQIIYTNDNITKATLSRWIVNIGTMYHTGNNNVKDIKALKKKVEDAENHLTNDYGLKHKTDENLNHFNTIGITTSILNTSKSDEQVFLDIITALDNKMWWTKGILKLDNTKTADDTSILDKIKSLLNNKVYINTHILLANQKDGSHKIQVLLNTSNEYKEILWDLNLLGALTNKTMNTITQTQYNNILTNFIQSDETFIDADEIELTYEDNNGVVKQTKLKTIINDTIANSTATLGNSTDIITNSNNITTNTTNIATNTTNIATNKSSISRNRDDIYLNVANISYKQKVIVTPNNLTKWDAKEGNFLKQIVNSNTIQTFIFKSYDITETGKKYRIIETVNLDKVFSDHVWEAINYKIEWKTDGSDLDVTKKAITTSRAQIPTNETISKIYDTAKESLRQLKEIVKVHKGDQIATTQKEALKYTPNNLKDFDDSLSIPVGLKKWINDNFNIDDRVINSQNVKECRVHLHWSSWKDDPFVKDGNTILIHLYAWLRTKMNTFDNIVTDSTFNPVDLYIKTTQTNALSTFHYKIAIVINKGKSNEKNAYLELQNGVSRIEDYDDTIAASTTLIKYIDRLKDEYINLNKVKVNDGITIRDFIDSRFINLETLSLTWDKVYSTSNCQYNGNENVKQTIPCLNKEEGSIRNCNLNVGTQTFTLAKGYYKISADINFYSTIYTGMGIDFTGNYVLSTDFVKTTSSYVNEGNNNMLRLGGIIKVNSTTTFTVKFKSSKTGTRNAAFCHNKTAIFNDYDYSKISVTKIGYIT